MTLHRESRLFRQQLDMRRASNPLSRSSFNSWKNNTASVLPPIVQVNNGTFYRRYPSPTSKDIPPNPPLFPSLIFSIPSFPSEPHHWAILGPSNAGKTTFLEVLRGQHLCVPPNARSYPYLSSPEAKLKDPQFRVPTRAIQYVGFNGEGGGVGRSGTRGAYLSARYESRRESTDFSVLDYLQGNTELNPSGDGRKAAMNLGGLSAVVQDLRLEDLLDMPMGNLSNGQTRRARIAKALLGRPELLLLDEPFMGLDPPTLKTLSPLLHDLAKRLSPRLLLALRTQDLLPDWITHLVYLGPNLNVEYQGQKEEVLGCIRTLHHGLYKHLSSEFGQTQEPESNALPHVLDFNVNRIDKSDPQRFQDSPANPRNDSSESSLNSCQDVSSQNKAPPIFGEALVEMQNVVIRYGEKRVLGDWKQNIDGHLREGLWWTVRRGERWGIFGPNGSGKTTLISLICSDHPQSYSLPIKVFGHGRLPTPGHPGISIFDIQARIGQSSPEIHAFFPRNLTIRQTLQNAWADTFLGTPRLSHRHGAVVNRCLQWFEPELNSLFRTTEHDRPLKHAVPLSGQTQWADTLLFGDVPFSSQRVALFLRALVKKPDLIVLDEAFSGMDESMRDKCMSFLTWGIPRHIESSGRKESFVGNEQSSAGLAISGLTEDQALICISHVKEEVPGLVSQWMCLPETGEGKPPRIGRFEKALEGHVDGWSEIWQI